MRYISAPILAIVYSFSYPSFYKLREDPLHILGFGVGHVALLLILSGFIVPRWYNALIPPPRREEGKHDLGAHAPMMSVDDVASSVSAEAGVVDEKSTGSGSGSANESADRQDKVMTHTDEAADSVQKPKKSWFKW